LQEQRVEAEQVSGRDSRKDLRFARGMARRGVGARVAAADDAGDLVSAQGSYVKQSVIGTLLGSRRRW
jgi:hypothetical protein